MKRKIFTAPYGPDIDVNVFGDYDVLVCIASQETALDKLTDLKWSLCSWTGAPTRTLTETELHSVLKSFFFQQANSVLK